MEVTHLGKRLYNDELKLVDEDDEGSRRRYEIYGFEPSFEDEEGSDLSAIAQGRISVSTLHFDLTDRAGLDTLRTWELDRMLAEASSVRRGHRVGRDRRRCALTPAKAKKKAAKKKPAKSPAERAEQLRAEIAKHDHAYYVLDDPTISDTDYDDLLRELQGIEAENPDLVTPDSPTQRVGGAPVEKFKRVEHTEPMLSLANARDEDELRAWGKRVERGLERLDIEGKKIRFVTEPKVDGLAISLTYENGVLTRGATRGDGPDRRGGDPEPAHDEVGPAADQGRARAGRGARRGLPADRGLREAERGAGRRRRGRRSRTRGTRRRARSASSTRSSRQRGP